MSRFTPRTTVLIGFAMVLTGAAFWCLINAFHAGTAVAECERLAKLTSPQSALLLHSSSHVSSLGTTNVIKPDSKELCSSKHKISKLYWISFTIFAVLAFLSLLLILGILGSSRLRRLISGRADKSSKQDDDTNGPQIIETFTNGQPQNRLQFYQPPANQEPTTNGSPDRTQPRPDRTQPRPDRTQPLTNGISHKTQPLTNGISHKPQPLTNVKSDKTQPLTNGKSDKTQPLTNGNSHEIRPLTKGILQETSANSVAYKVKPLTNDISDKTAGFPIDLENKENIEWTADRDTLIKLTKEASKSAQANRIGFSKEERLNPTWPLKGDGVPRTGPGSILKGELSSDFLDITVEELRSMCRRHNIKYAEGHSKNTLVRLIKSTEVGNARALAGK